MARPVLNCVFPPPTLQQRRRQRLLSRIDTKKGSPANSHHLIFALETTPFR